MNLTGPLIVRVTAAGRDSSLARLTALVAAAESARGRYTSLAERASRLYSPLVHLLAFGQLSGLVLGDGRPAPFDQCRGGGADHHLSLRAGAGGAGGGDGSLGRLFRRGMLIKNGTAPNGWPMSIAWFSTRPAR